MLIFNNKTYQINTLNPDTNYLEGLDCEQPKWVISDDSALANKIKSTPYWEAVTDERDNLIDITPIDQPVTAEDQIAALKSQLTAIDVQTVRPLRAIAAGTATDEDRDRLAKLEVQAEELRAKITLLKGGDKV